MVSRYGQWLIENRNQLGWSRNELAERSGYSSQQIYNLEKGLREFSLHHLELFSELFDCSISLTISKGEVEIMSTEKIETIEPKEGKEMKKETLSNHLENTLTSLKEAIDLISKEEICTSFELRINTLIDELWMMNFSTDALEEAKVKIIEDFIDNNKEIQSFIASRQAYLVDEAKSENQLPPKRLEVFNAISDFQFNVGEESVFAIGEQLTELYDKVQSVLNSPK